MRFVITKKRLLLVILSFAAIAFCLWFGWLYYEHSKTSQRISSPISTSKESRTPPASKRTRKPRVEGKVSSKNRLSDKELALLWEILKEDILKEEQDKKSKESIKVEEEPIDSESDEKSSSSQESGAEEWSTIDEWVDDIYEGMEIGTYLGEVEIDGKKYPARLGIPIEVTWYGPGTDNPRKRTEEEQRRYDELGRELDNVDPQSPRAKQIIAEMERIDAETSRPAKHQSQALYRKMTKEQLREGYIRSTPEERRNLYRMWAKKYKENQ